MNPFHKFLLKHRPYCEHKGCFDKLTPSTKVVKINGTNYCYCDWHGYGPIEQGLRYRAELEQSE